jgi:adenosylcobinamide-phosphate synthase
MAVPVIAITGGVTFSIIRLAASFHLWAGDVLLVLFIYPSLSIRNLGKHSMDVYRSLGAGNLAKAREQVSWIVGRGTENLAEKVVIRATVKCVAENRVDGIFAPLLFAVLFDHVGAMMYKAVSTLDFMVGYKNEKYFYFG